ncbi:uncharacterized protein LOC142239091 [Haematobia irritans]|uniref:uncharacterized protein LOC142239091 n=1 Tax=Haematobia irritans TaxID=7368 RepID=UPI003F5067E7
MSSKTKGGKTIIKSVVNVCNSAKPKMIMVSKVKNIKDTESRPHLFIDLIQSEVEDTSGLEEDCTKALSVKSPINQLTGSSKLPITPDNPPKSVQTDLPFSLNICGLVDISKYEVICVYCFQTFPIKKWPFLINHVKLMHYTSSKPTTGVDDKEKSQPSIVNEKHVNTIKENPKANTCQNNLKRPLTNDDQYRNINNTDGKQKNWKSDSSDESNSESNISTDSVPCKENVDIQYSKKYKKVDKIVSSSQATTLTSKFCNQTKTDAMFDSCEEQKSLDCEAVEHIIASECTEHVSTQASEEHKHLDDMVSSPMGSTSTWTTVEKTKTDEFLDIKEEQNSMDYEDVEQLIELSPAYSEIPDKSSVNDRQEEICSIDIECDWNQTEPPVNNEAISGSVSNEDKSPSPTKKIIADKLKSPNPSIQLSRYVDSEDEMPSNDENEDLEPSSTNGCGILFGLTNRKIVIEFLEHLEKYPHLYQFRKYKGTPFNSAKFQESIVKLRTHINTTFNIDMTDIETRLSIQRIKHWYARTIQTIEDKKAYGRIFKHTFPEYFNIMKAYLPSDVTYSRDLLLESGYAKKETNELTRYPTWMLRKKGAISKRGVKLGRKRKNQLEVTKITYKDLMDDEVHLECEEKEKPSEMDDDGFTPPDPLICDICFVDFSRPVELRQHRLRHFPPKHACQYCLRKHYTQNLAKKCQHKDTPASSATKIKAKPNKDGLYMCELCGATYKSLGYLNYHKKDKHFNQRHKCDICGYSTIKKTLLEHHQKRYHVVEFGTCGEIAKRTRPPLPKIRFTAEGRREYLWLREMKAQKPTEPFFGCYRCKQIFRNRQEKNMHNKREHPISATTVICFLCHHENVLFSNMKNLRRHYLQIHRVAPEGVDSLLKHVKPLMETLTEEEVEDLQTAENHNLVLAQILATKPRMKPEEFLSDMNSDYYKEMMCQRRNLEVIGHYDDDESIDDLGQSTLWEEVDQGYEELCGLYKAPNSDIKIEDPIGIDMSKDDIENQTANLEMCIDKNEFCNNYLGTNNDPNQSSLDIVKEEEENPHSQNIEHIFVINENIQDHHEIEDIIEEEDFDNDIIENYFE